MTPIDEKTGNPLDNYMCLLEPDCDIREMSDDEGEIFIRLLMMDRGQGELSGMHQDFLAQCSAYRIIHGRLPKP